MTTTSSASLRRNLLSDRALLQRAESQRSERSAGSRDGTADEDVGGKAAAGKQSVGAVVTSESVKNNNNSGSGDSSNNLPAAAAAYRAEEDGESSARTAASDDNGIRIPTRDGSSATHSRESSLERCDRGSDVDPNVERFLAARSKYSPQTLVSPSNGHTCYESDESRDEPRRLSSSLENNRAEPYAADHAYRRFKSWRSNPSLNDSEARPLIDNEAGRRSPPRSPRSAALKMADGERDDLLISNRDETDDIEARVRALTSRASSFKMTSQLVTNSSDSTGPDD